MLELYIKKGAIICTCSTHGEMINAKKLKVPFMFS